MSEADQEEGTLLALTAHPLQRVGAYALATLAATKLRATVVFDHPTCLDLARHLADGPLAATIPPAAPAAAPDGFDALGTDELAALLEQELAAAGRQLDETVR